MESIAAETLAPEPGPASLRFSYPIKVLAGSAAILILAAACGIGFGLVSMRDFFIKAIDPQYMRDTAVFITGVADPVPEPGFNPVMAAKLNRAVVFYENPKDKAQVSFWSYKGEDIDAVQELDTAYDTGLWTPSSWAKFQSISKKGKKDINGKAVTYVQGPVKDQSGDIYEGLIACIIEKNKSEDNKTEGEKITLLQAMEPSDRPFDTDKLLAWLARP